MKRLPFVLMVVSGGILWLALGQRAFPQVAEKQEATGTVTGHVYCADTNGPARLARVMLEPVSDVSHAVEEAGQSRPPVNGQQPVLTTVNSIQTGPDGSFMVGDLKPGVYYITAALPGYLSDSGLSGNDWVHPSASVADRMAKGLQRVTVEVGRTAEVNLTLERGASVNGTVSFSDGTPAELVSVKVLSEKSDGSWAEVGVQATDRSFGGVTTTNDLGQYRIAGLSAGLYVIEVDLTIFRSQTAGSLNGSSSGGSSGGYQLSIFSGGKLKASKDAAFALTAGESRLGEDLVLPKLHSVSGVVVAARDGRPLVGNIRLLDSDGKTGITSASVESTNGDFRFEGVPEGNFVLEIYAADPQSAAAKNPANARVYGMVQQPIDVSADIDGLVVSVPPFGMPVSALDKPVKHQ